MGAGAGCVLFAAGAYIRDPQGRAVGGGEDLDVAAVLVVLARPPQVHPGGRAERPGAVGTDQGAVELHMGVAGGAGGQQGALQPGASAASASMPAVELLIWLSAVSWVTRVASRNQRSTSTRCDRA